MGLLNLLPTSHLGLGGQLPKFKTLPNPPGSLHRTYSVDGVPPTLIQGINPAHPLPLPSRLDEKDTNNNNKYKSQLGKRYIDNLPG
jgi:hypothetical protein